jgi:hypothetical protein
MVAAALIGGRLHDTSCLSTGTGVYALAMETFAAPMVSYEVA